MVTLLSRKETDNRRSAATTNPKAETARHRGDYR
jgi:hypothetical protein